MAKHIPQPTEIKLHQKSNELEVAFADKQRFHFSCEFLRVYSPSAEVRGHGEGQGVLQVGKENVTIEKIEPVGNYAVKLVFSDKHDSGIYSWDLFYHYGLNQDTMWQDYLNELEKAGHQRKSPAAH